MKKFVVLCFILMLSLGLCACLNDTGGNVSDVQIINVPSEIYSQAEIDSAIQLVKNDFATDDWHGCTLKELYYAGDSITKDAQKRASLYKGDEVMVLMSSFYVDSSGGDTFNPNSTYDRWNWILVRTSKGSWRLVDTGY